MDKMDIKNNSITSDEKILKLVFLYSRLCADSPDISTAHPGNLFFRLC